MITGWSKWILQWKYCTDMQEKVKARLCESPPPARGSQEAGYLHVCIWSFRKCHTTEIEKDLSNSI